MALSKTAQDDRQELQGLADSIPFRKIELDLFRKRSFDPEKIRQPRVYERPDSSGQAISRFLLERGRVELLKPKQTHALFIELHWCAYQIRKLARKRFKRAADVHEALIQARRYISEMEAAEEELFIANRRLVVNCVKPYFWIGPVWIADFLQEGSRALSNAIRKFDFTRGTPFFAYAQRSIQNRMLNFFRDHIRSGSIHIHPSKEMILIQQMETMWEEAHNKKPDDATLARLTGLSEKQIRKIKPFMKHWQAIPWPTVSLDASMGETEVNLYDLIEDEDNEGAAESAQKQEIRDAMNQLPERSRHVMISRYIKGMTLEETGQTLNLTRARIKQIQDEALRKLRAILKRPPLKEK